jgi:ADP-heptose:LPS heptosyltransferase
LSGVDARAHPESATDDVPARADTPLRRLEGRAQRYLTRVLVRCLRPRPPAPQALQEGQVRRLLLIRQHNQLGDMVLALPALRALRHAYPHAHLVFVAGPLCEDLLRGHAEIDELRIFRKREMRKPWRLWSFLHRLRRPRPDLAVVLGSVSFSTTSALLAWASGARVRVGVSSRPFGSELSSALYHLELPLAPDAVHEVEHTLAPLRAMGIAATDMHPELEATPAARAAAQRFLRRAFAGSGAPVLVLHAGAGKEANLWPTRHFASVAQALVAEYGMRVVLLEGPRDDEVVSELATRLPEATRWKGSLSETFGLLSESALYVGSDTGPAHVAAALGVRSVIIFGPTPIERWAPAGRHVRCVIASTRRTIDAKVTDVLDAARQLLQSDLDRSADPTRQVP